MQHNKRIHKYLYREDTNSGVFLMLPPDLFAEPAFQNLKHAARTFYLLLCAHKETDMQRKALYMALKEYNSLLGLGLTEQEIKDEAMPGKRTKVTSNLFVIPEKHLLMYGYSSSYASKLKGQLIAAGFIKVKYGKKGRYNGWNENETIYQFSSDWKKSTFL